MSAQAKAWALERGVVVTADKKVDGAGDGY